MIRTRGLGYRYPAGPALAFADLDLPQGGTLLLQGASGAGKSTWLALVAGLLRASGGELRVADQDLSALRGAALDAWRGRHVGFLPQRLHLSDALTVEGNLALAWYAAGLPVDRVRLEESLRLLGVEALAGRRPAQLSGGQAQRVALARALQLQPQVLLADEPTASLDDANAEAAIALLRESAGRSGASLVIATHDARVRAALPDAQVLRLEAAVADRMKTARLAWQYLWARPLAALLNLLLLTLGLASITFVLLVSAQVSRAFQRDLAGIDLVVGAKGSPVQLILAGVFHIDVPPGNIALADVRELQKQPQVAQLIPLSLGDSFRGARIVGTSTDYPKHYGMRLAEGALWAAPMEAVVGAESARSTGLQVGAQFIGTHGLGAGGHAHGDTPYRVTGVFAPCGCVLDRLILTGLESVWKVHEKALATDEEDRQALEEAREITLALVRYKSPLAAASFPRYVNTQTEMQAAAPAIEITRLLRMLGVGTEVLQGIGAVLLLTAGLSVFIALWTAVRERRADLAMLRMLGAPPWKVAALVVTEALWLALLAAVIGLAAGHALTALVGSVLQAKQSLPLSGFTWVPAEAAIPVVALLTAALAALIPAISAYRVDVAQLLSSSR